MCYVFGVLCFGFVTLMGALVALMFDKRIVQGTLVATVALAGAALGCFLTESCLNEEAIAAGETVVRTEVRTVTVTRIDPPKHYYVEFRDKISGTTSNHWIGKHCFSYRKITVGANYDLQVKVTTNALLGNREKVTYVNLYKVFCPS